MAKKKIPEEIPTNCAQSAYNVRYRSEIKFKYWDRVRIIWHNNPMDYTYSWEGNEARFYDWQTWTVVGIESEYPFCWWNEVKEVLYLVHLDEDLSEWFIRNTLKFSDCNLELIEEEKKGCVLSDDEKWKDFYTYDFTSEDNLKRFIGIAKQSLDDILEVENEDVEKTLWALQLKECLDLANAKLNE